MAEREKPSGLTRAFPMTNSVFGPRLVLAVLAITVARDPANSARVESVMVVSW